MVDYSVHIFEIVDEEPEPLRPRDKTPEVRSVFTKVSAGSAQEAQQPASWGHAWQAKYGTRSMPEKYDAEITEL